MRSFTFRTLCRFAALVTTTSAAVLYVGGLLLDREVEHGLEVLHDIEVRELTELIGTARALTAEEVSARIKHDADSDAAMFVMQVADANGNVLFRSENLGATILPAAEDTHQHWTSEIPFLGRVHLSMYVVGPWRIHVGSPLEPSERVLRSYARVALILLVGVGLVSVGLGYAFSRATLRPIRAIEETARRITADNLKERIPMPLSRDELASLTSLLNQTFDRLESSFEQVRRFSADVSHELKTPLALIRLNVEKLRARLSGDPDATAALGDVLEELERMHHVIDRLLFLARAESGALAVAAKELDVAGFVMAFAEDARVLAEDRGVQFEVVRNDAGAVRADPDLLRQLLLNLVSNAVAVSRPGSWVNVESVAQDREWQLVVTDEGPGLPAADLQRVFNRFVRVTDSSRRHQSAGHGLGLAICKSIVELHHGRIQAENRTDGPGLRVTVTLPR